MIAMKPSSLIALCLLLLPGPAQAEEKTQDEGSSYKLVLLGRVELHPNKATHVHPGYTGIVKEVYKGVGAAVKAGDALARLETNIGIQHHTMQSSIQGVILEKNVIPGQTVTEGMEAFSIADTGTVQVNLVVYPRDLPHLKKGTEVHFERGAGQPMDVAQISFISPIIDEDTGTIRAYATLKNETGFWRPGQYIIGNIK